MNSETRKPRGKGIKPAMVHINVRLPEHVVDYFKLYTSYTGEMRSVLEKHVEHMVANVHSKSFVKDKYKNI